jgi:mannose-1-phosphate guanylyltransferase/mannose-6-phosphate isomerase
MARHAVIMCGGSGTRLWPASRPSRPKQFIALAGDRSLFQNTALRVAPLAGEDGSLVVVAGHRHLAHLRLQLAEIGLEATILIEPDARDSGPAMTAAAAWLRRRDPAAVAIFVASDHHIPDGEAFRRDVGTAAAAAEQGCIVTLGVTPTEPSPAYGYIRPARPGLSPVDAFVEKPDVGTAARWVAEGYLWNSGNFIVRADTLLQEVAAFSPTMLAAAEESVSEAHVDPVHPSAIFLGQGFLGAPRQSIDYAVMEKTRRAFVLPVRFTWSDLGAWDAVARIADGPQINLIAEAGTGCHVHAPEGVLVATLGVSDVAIVVEPDAVLVCALARAQEVKALAERARARRSENAVETAATPSLSALAGRFTTWLRSAALPLWSTLGVEEDGAFNDVLDEGGRGSGRPRRARVQARQAYVLAHAGAAGWRGPWRPVVTRGLARFAETNARPDGLYATLTAPDGRVLDDTAALYDQAFVLFALAAAARSGIEPDTARARAHALWTTLAAQRLPQGGWREAGAHPFQANAHMHLFEAALAWAAVDPAGPWDALADEIAALCLTHFIDPAGGFLREFFTADWSPAPGEDGRLVEPGHQFEWAWLLTRWAILRDRPDAEAAARRLFQAGARGIDHARGVAVDALDDTLTVVSARARLWPQTERIKAALLLAERNPDDRPVWTAEAAAGLAGLSLYLRPNGTWADKLNADGSFVEEPAPASSLYHIFAAWEQLAASAAVLPELADADLALA